MSSCTERLVALARRDSSHVDDDGSSPTRANVQCVFWAIVMSASLIMEGYDKSLIGNFWALPAFGQKYGRFDPVSKSWNVDAKWQVAIAQASTIGSFCMLC
jgi:hypothetical protein